MNAKRARERVVTCAKHGKPLVERPWTIPITKHDDKVTTKADLPRVCLDCVRADRQRLYIATQGRAGSFM